MVFAYDGSMHRFNKNALQQGFTLIELSIVLVIIGLIVGGVLVGRDLINAATVRSQISQIEKYNVAANTFKGKYGYLPGDINASAAAQFGFTARGTGAGEGDGNGIISGDLSLFNEAAGEEVMFWTDLTYANGLKINMIDGTFTAAVPTPGPSTITGNTLNAYFPTAKMGNGNYVYVTTGGQACFTCASDGFNYFGVAVIVEVDSGSPGGFNTNPGMTVQQAYGIDKKIDDGLPQTGGVMAQYLHTNSGGSGFQWAAGGGGTGTADTSSTAGTSTTCYDNNSSAGAIQQYSVKQSGGTNVNCALSFRFQ